MKWTKKQIGDAVNAGLSLLSYGLELAPTGRVGKTLALVFREVVPRVLGWFTQPVKEVKNDALFKAIRKPLRSRILLNIEREKRGR